MPYRQLIVCVLCTRVSYPFQTCPCVVFFSVPHPPVLFRGSVSVQHSWFLFELFPCHSGNVRVERKKNKKRTALLIRQVYLESLCSRQCFWSSVWRSCCCCCFTPPPPPPPVLDELICRFLNHALFFLFFHFFLFCVRVCLSTLEAPQNGCCQHSCRQLEKFLS